MLYEQPKNILEMRLNELLSKEEESLISDIIRISLLKTAEKDENYLVFTEIYNLLGLEKFTELITLIDGGTIVFPSKDELRDAVLTVVCYYYRNVLNKDWEEIKTLLNLPDISSVKYGIKSSQLELFIDNVVKKRLSREETK